MYLESADKIIFFLELHRLLMGQTDPPKTTLENHFLIAFLRMF